MDSFSKRRNILLKSNVTSYSFFFFFCEMKAKRCVKSYNDLFQITSVDVCRLQRRTMYEESMMPDRHVVRTEEMVNCKRPWDFMDN